MKNKQIIITALIAVPLIVLIGTAVWVLCYSNIKRSFLPTDGSYNVKLIQNRKDNSKTDVFLYGSLTKQEKFFAELADVYSSHYHAAEFSNGYLFVIKRIVTTNNMQTGEWTDELWKYSERGTGEKIFSAKGIDFRVSTKNNVIAVLSVPDEAKPFEYELALIDFDGKKITTANNSKFPYLKNNEALNILSWEDDILWLTSSEGNLVTNLYSFDIASFSIKIRNK